MNERERFGGAQNEVAETEKAPLDGLVILEQFTKKYPEDSLSGVIKSNLEGLKYNQDKGNQEFIGHFKQLLTEELDEIQNRLSQEDFEALANPAEDEGNAEANDEMSAAVEILSRYVEKYPQDTLSGVIKSNLEGWKYNQESGNQEFIGHFKTMLTEELDEIQRRLTPNEFADLTKSS